MSWRADELESRCGRENQQRGWAPRPPVEQPRRTRTTHGDAWRDWGGQYVAVLFGLQHPLTRNLSNKVRGIFFKEVFARLYYCVNMYSACICVYMHIYCDDYITKPYVFNMYMP